MVLFVKENKQDLAKNILFKQEVNEVDGELTVSCTQYVVETT